ncbi:MAG: hypothetical protein ABF384_12570 [Verrucomicrobiales bacterium]
MIHPSSIDTHLARLSKLVGRSRAVTIQHPAELRTFKGLSPDELRIAAAEHDLRVVHRMGNRKLEFTRLAKA